MVDPRDVCAAIGSGPDAAFILSEPIVGQKGDAARIRVGNRCADVGDTPAKHRMGVRHIVSHQTDPQHRAAEIVDEREGIF